jgi:hypothetical protein
MIIYKKVELSRAHLNRVMDKKVLVVPRDKEVVQVVNKKVLDFYWHHFHFPPHQPTGLLTILVSRGFME